MTGCENLAKDTTESNKSIKVAAVQFNPQLNERDKNIEALLKVVEEAAQNGAKLIVTPEMATTGYQYASRKAIEPFVDTIPGVTTQKFEKVAKKYDCYIVIGMAEVDKETGIFYNSAALIGPEGYIGKYRKTHLWETEAHWATPGDLGIPVFDTEIGKIAINICMDSAYFEPARLAALNGADILAFPTNSSGQAIWALQARAMQNGLYIVSANRSNTENEFHMVGASAVWSPEGEKLAEAEFVATEEEDIDEPTIIYAEIDALKYDNEAKRRLKERRPELYKELMLYISPWDYTKTTTPREVTAAILQYEPESGDKEANITKIQKLIEDAVAKTKGNGEKLDLIVLPELATTGPVKDLEEASKLAETLNGNTVETFKKIANTHSLYIIFGMIEKDGDKLYNTAVLVGPKGDIIGRYRKTHLNELDKLWATPGDEIEVFSTELGKIGIMIGYDAAFPEVAGVMAVKRADIIAIPSAWKGDFGAEIKINRDISANRYPEGAMCLWDSIAMSSQAYTIVSNFIGTSNNYLGRSALYTLDPIYGLDQPIVASGNKEEVLVVSFKTIQPDWWFNQEKLISSRRTCFYKPLVK
ncbi:MAG TPA: nitrilase [Peptococcaceae bacterium]|nr:nitrilase [Peptococcaceae bacterium]